LAEASVTVAPRSLGSAMSRRCMNDWGQSFYIVGFADRSLGVPPKAIPARLAPLR
jgi:hypothetical protein